MARLPQSLDVGAPQGQRPTTNVPRPTDFGLGDLAQGVGAWAQVQEQQQTYQAEAQAKANALKAQDILRPYQAQFEARFAEVSQTDAPDQPNFAAAQLAHLDDHFMAVINTGDEGVQAAMKSELDRYRTAVGARAIQTQSNRRATIVAAQENQKQAAQAGQLLTSFMDDYAGRKQALTDSFDGSRPGFTKDLTATHQEAMTALMESDAYKAAPPEVQVQVLSRLNSSGIEEHAKALTVEASAHEAYIARSATSTASALVNTVLSNPIAWNGISRDLDDALAAIPNVELRTKTKDTYMAEAAAARVRGLIAKGQEDQALSELQDGQFDKLLSPDAKATLLGVARSAADGGPRTVQQWLARSDAEQSIDAEVSARQRGQTTGYNLQAAVEMFSPQEIAKYQADLIQADRQFAATGAPRQQTISQLQAHLNAPPPELTDPDYARKMQARVAAQKSAEDELKTRADPAAWAMMSERAGDTGAQLQTKFQAFLTAPDPASRGKAGANYAILSLGLQQRGGIPPSSMRVLSKQTALAMAKSYVDAPPERRAAALQSLAETVYALPPNVRMGDGTVVSARQLALRELLGGLSKPAISAIVDLHDNPSTLALYADAAHNPSALKPLQGPGQETSLTAHIDDALHDFLGTTSGLPGTEELNYGRKERVKVMARHLMDVKGMSVSAAVREAASDLTDSYRFVDGWRIPVSKAREQVRGAEVWQLARNGAARVLDDLHKGENLMPAPGTPGMTLQQRQLSAADQVQNHGRWITQEGDGGLQLMIPDKRGFAPVLDKYGRPVRVSWDQLAARGRSLAAPNSWMPPPPSGPSPRAIAPDKAAKAFSQAIEWKESRFQPGLKSPAGALGAMQLMPGTAKAAAARLGIAFDPARLQGDSAYNRKLGNEEIRFLSQRYGGNIALIAAAYNAGPGAVDKWIKAYGDPRKGEVDADQFVAQIPYGETRDYVRSVLPRAVTYLKS